MRRVLYVVAIVALVQLTACSGRSRENAAPPGAVEAEIRRLEQMEVEAVLNRDTATVGKLWDKAFVVNNPDNQIVVATADPADRPVMSQPRTAFTRQIEHLTVHDDVVVSMGHETVVPAGDRPDAGRTITRRYTNIWKRVDGAWKLIARHANVVTAR